MTDNSGIASTDTLIAAGVRLLTPPLRTLYAVLVQAGIVVIDED